MADLRKPPIDYYRFSTRHSRSDVKTAMRSKVPPASLSTVDIHATRQSPGGIKHPPTTDDKHDQDPLPLVIASEDGATVNVVEQRLADAGPALVRGGCSSATGASPKAPSRQESRPLQCRGFRNFFDAPIRSGPARRLIRGKHRMSGVHGRDARWTISSSGTMLQRW